MVEPFVVSGLVIQIIVVAFNVMAYQLWRRARADGALIWVELGKSMVLIGIAFLAATLAVSSVSIVSLANLRFVWLFVFGMFLLTAVITARYCWRTGRMLKELLGEDASA